MSALASLVYKREYVDEEPKRPLLIWGMDVSKQVIAESTIHVYNVAFGILIDQMDQGSSNDQCAFYLMNELMDTVIGTFFVWIFTLGIESVGQTYQIREIANTGYYGIPPQVNFYLLQLLTFMISNLVGKTLVTMICLSDPRAVESVGAFLFDELGVSPDVELTLVMCVLPLIMTVLQMWVVDTFLGFDTEAESHRNFHYRQLSEPLRDEDGDASGGTSGIGHNNSTHGLSPVMYTPPYSSPHVRGKSMEKLRSEL